MKKFLLLVAVGFMMASMAETASASFVITDTTTFSATDAGDDPTDLLSNGGSAVNLLEGAGDWLSWQHQYSFNPPLAAINSASLAITFSDVAGAGSGRVLNYKKDFAFGYTESGNWASGEINAGTKTFSIGLSSLGDGIFKVTIIDIWGDFYVNKSVLAINYNAAPAPVPEPATMLLLGTGLTGLAGVLRKKKA